MAPRSKIYVLRALWAELNTLHWGGSLLPIPIRITRSRNTYGYFNAPNSGGRTSIRISTVLAGTPELVRDTMAHEMIHQQLYERDHPEWDTHGEAFQHHHQRIFGHLYEEPT